MDAAGDDGGYGRKTQGNFLERKVPLHPSKNFADGYGSGGWRGYETGDAGDLLERRLPHAPPRTLPAGYGSKVLTRAFCRRQNFGGFLEKVLKSLQAAFFRTSQKSAGISPSEKFRPYQKAKSLKFRVKLTNIPDIIPARQYCSSLE